MQLGKFTTTNQSKVACEMLGRATVSGITLPAASVAANNKAASGATLLLSSFIVSNPPNFKWMLVIGPSCFRTNGNQREGEGCWTHPRERTNTSSLVRFPKNIHAQDTRTPTKEGKTKMCESSVNSLMKCKASNPMEPGTTLSIHSWSIQIQLYVNDIAQDQDHPTAATANCEHSPWCQVSHRPQQ